MAGVDMAGADIARADMISGDHWGSSCAFQSILQIFVYFMYLHLGWNVVFLLRLNFFYSCLYLCVDHVLFKV